MITSLAAVLGVFSLACEGEGSAPVQPAEQERFRTLHLTTFVSERCSPYVARVNVSGGQGAKRDWEEPVASGNWSHDMLYRKGAGLRVVLTADPKDMEDHKNCGSSDGWCEIKDGDGPKGTGKIPMRVSGVALCTYETS